MIKRDMFPYVMLLISVVCIVMFGIDGFIIAFIETWILFFIHWTFIRSKNGKVLDLCKMNRVAPLILVNELGQARINMPVEVWHDCFFRCKDGWKGVAATDTGLEWVEEEQKEETKEAETEEADKS